MDVEESDTTNGIETEQIESHDVGEIEENLKSMTIQVTLEQESAMEAFFQINNWQLIKEKREMTTTDGVFTCTLTLKVTAEQEAAIEAFFQINNWTLIRVESGLTSLTKILHDINSTQDLIPASDQILVSDGTTVEEVHGLHEVQVTAPGTDGKPQIITVYTEGGDAHGIPQSLLTGSSGEDMLENPQVIIQEITLPDGLSIDQGLVITNTNAAIKKITPRGSIKPGDKVYQCHVCNKTFKQAASFHGHYQSHFGSKPYQCDICQTGFTLKAALVAHQSIHTGAKPFACALCNKGFRRKDDMISHIRTHTGEKPYECDICGKKFKYRNQIPKHRRAHTGDKPYKCDHCPKSFTSNIHLRRHERTHTGERPYVCVVCQKAFTQCGHLQAHMRIHTDERPFTCSICGRGFREKKVMKKHERLHTTERKYKCDICGKGFLRQSNLELHSVMHQKERDGALLVRPRPKSKKKPDAQMRDFVTSVLINVKKVDSCMQTDSLVTGLPYSEENTVKTLDIAETRQQNIDSSLVNYTGQEPQSDIKIDQVTTLESINGAEHYTMVLQDDGTESYLIHSYDQNAVGEEVVSQQVEISTGNATVTSNSSLQSDTLITSEDEIAIRALNDAGNDDNAEEQRDDQINSSIGLQMAHSVIHNIGSIRDHQSMSKVAAPDVNGEIETDQSDNSAITML